MTPIFSKSKPEAAIMIGIDEIPLPSQYGAAELKFYIRRNTQRGTLITLILLLLILLLNFVVDTVQSTDKIQLVAPINKISLEDLPPPSAENADIPPPPDVIINTGPATRAGNPIPVPDAMIAPDVKDFATTDLVHISSTEGGDGTDITDWEKNIQWEKTDVAVTKLDEPDPDEFVLVEKDPQFDLKKLQGLVVYPEAARKAGIEGRVLVRALVDKSGKITKTIIDFSEAKALESAAMKAVLDYGYAVPAFNNNQPVSCWVTVPIVFKLK